ncbi:hypothetical protein ES705_35340 [subsurface metagenome]
MTAFQTSKNSNWTPQHVLTPSSVSKCGSGAILGVKKDEPAAVIIPTTCKSWHCPKCKKPKALRLIDKICSGDPERMITLTCNPKIVASPFDAITLMKLGWGRLVRKIRHDFGEFEYALVWELTKRGWPHIHVACRGKYIAHSYLKYWWASFTQAPVVNITKIHSERHAARYLGKYFVKDQGAILRILDGRRLVQISKAWSLRDEKSFGGMKPSDYTWYRLNFNTSLAISEMVRLHHSRCDPNGKGKLVWFMLENDSVIPGTDGLTWQSLFALHPPPYKCNSPPLASLDASPLQKNLVF